MPNWSAEELRQASSIIKSIDRCDVPRRSAPANSNIELALSRAESLKEEMSEAYRGLIVRQLRRALGFNEHRQFQWRLEHKLVQALVIDHYCAAASPVTRGLGLQAQSLGQSSLRRSLEEEFPACFFIKRALGDSSGDLGAADATEKTLAAIEAGEILLKRGHALPDESWIVQEKIPIKIEYRVHSLEDRVIEDQTFRRYGTGDIPGERDAPNAYVQSLLDRLPAGMVNSSLCGWDVALTEKGDFRVIEVNYSGFHPVYRRGFQCSGYFLDADWGAKSVASLIRFIEKSDGISISVHADSDVESEEKHFYSEVIRWRQKLKEISGA